MPEERERPDFNTLHGFALQRIAMDRRCGVPEDAIRWMINRWLSDLVKYDMADESDCQKVALVLDDDGAFHD